MELDGKKVHAVLKIPNCTKCNNLAQRIFLVGTKEYEPRCWTHAQTTLRMEVYKFLEEDLIPFIEEVIFPMDHSHYFEED